jgi:glycine/sarcosine/betaine reductase complex component C subunit beta
VSPTPAITHAVLTLQHAPDLVRHGSKPTREPAQLPRLLAKLRSFDDASVYPPHQVVVGNRSPASLRDLPRPWWRDQPPGKPVGPFGEIVDQRALYDLLAELDRFELLRIGQEPRPGDLPLYLDGEPFGAFAPDHEADETLTANVLLENLSCLAGAVHATRHLLATSDVDPASVTHVLNCGEEAIGDRYQRGGGNLAKAVAEASGLTEASGADVKAFCAGPIHALIVAGALVRAGVHERVAVVAGGSLAKLGMKFLGALEHEGPIVDDTLAAMAVLVGPAEDDPTAAVIRMDAVGKHRTGSSSQQSLLEDIVGRPLDAMGIAITDVATYATELHDPEVTEPAGGGDVADRNYKMLAGLGVVRGELTKDAMAAFARDHGLPGFAPTQGHIASAMPWLPHAIAGIRAGELDRTMLLAKGSLFLGRMTRLWDGASITLEAPR